MLSIPFFIRFCMMLGLLVTMASAREWSDASGNYRIEAELLAFNDTTVVLKKEDGSLLSVKIEDLSAADQEYIKTQEGKDEAPPTDQVFHVWTLADGLQVRGNVIDYARRDVTLQRRRGRIYVNDRRFDSLPAVYQKMIPGIVAHFENIEINNLRDLERWITPLRGAPQTFTCDGVLMELENGDMYAIPFFFLSARDQEVLRSGWEQWLAAEKDHKAREHQAFLLQAQEEARQRDRDQLQHVMQLQLKVQAFQAGLFNLWEVSMFPAAGVIGQPVTVVVPGRTSSDAAAAATQMNPGFAIAAIAQVRRWN